MSKEKKATLEEIGDCSKLSQIEKPTLKDIIEGINRLSTMGHVVELECVTFPAREITDFMFKETVRSISEAVLRRDTELREKIEALEAMTPTEKKELLRTIDHLPQYYPAFSKEAPLLKKQDVQEVIEKA